MSQTIPAVVLGASGYVGGELLRLIAGHPNFELAAAVSDSRAGTRIGNSFRHLAMVCGDQEFVAHDAWLELLDSGGKLALFSAAPHGASAGAIAGALKAAAKKDIDVHVVDSSADFRYTRAAAYKNVYGSEHGAPDLLSQFACAVPEHAAAVKKPHIGHPGCFATAALLAAVPLVQSGLTSAELFISGITGSTGSGQAAAGRHPSPGTQQQPVRVQTAGTPALAGDCATDQCRIRAQNAGAFRAALRSVCARHSRDPAGQGEEKSVGRRDTLRFRAGL